MLMLMLMLASAIVILIGALLESSKVERRRKLAEQKRWDQDDDVVMLQSEDQSSSNIKNSNDDLVEYFGTSFRVVDDTAATDELQIEILNPKPKLQFGIKNQKYFSSSMDSSDGLSTTLNEMANQSKKKFLISKLSRLAVTAAKLPSWLLSDTLSSS